VEKQEDLQQAFTEQQARIEELEELIARLQRENERLSEQLTVLLNRLYRRKSEVIDPNQLWLFSAEELARPEEPEPPPAPEPTQPRRRKGHGRKGFPQHLPRQKFVLDLPEGERTCPDCGKEMTEFGEDVSERGHVIPAQIIVNQYVRKKYACPDNHTVLMGPPPPPTLIEKGKYEPSVYAHIAVGKFADHLPLNRQQGRFKRYDIDLPKQTMWEMLDRADEVAVGPILTHARRELLEEDIILADETPIVVLVENKQTGKKEPKTGYIWVYRSGKKILFDFTLGRTRDGPMRVLKGWTGTLQTDGYAGYDLAEREYKLKRAGCWSHARRKLKEALEAGSRDAGYVLIPIQRLFRIESAIVKRAKRLGLDEEGFLALRLEVRNRRSRKLVARIKARRDEVSVKRSTLPKSQLGEALGYLKNQERQLELFLEDPALDIHNNLAENALRAIAVGRANWLFAGSPRGGEVASHMYSLIGTCKALAINPEAYLEDVLQEVAANPSPDFAALTPWAWAERHRPPPGGPPSSQH
jgi:transposase